MEKNRSPHGVTSQATSLYDSSFHRLAEPGRRAHAAPPEPGVIDRNTMTAIAIDRPSRGRVTAARSAVELARDISRFQEGRLNRAANGDVITGSGTGSRSPVLDPSRNRTCIY